MHILICAVGRLGAAPENQLARDYLKRASAAGRGLAIHPVELTEVEPRKPGKAERRLVFLIGGADGLDAALVERADETLAFGPQTWPHALARLMLAEQVYRAVTILSGSPYHRD